MTKYLRGTVEESREVLMQEVVDAASDATFINILGAPKEPAPVQEINKTNLGLVMKEIAICMASNVSIPKTIGHVKRTLGIMINHDDVRAARKIIMAEYNERFKQEAIEEV